MQNLRLGFRSVMKEFPLRTTLVLTLVVASVLPALGLVVILSQAIRQLQSSPELLTWKELIGEQMAGWLLPYVKETVLESGISGELQKAYLPAALAIFGLFHASIRASIEYFGEDLSERVSALGRSKVMNSFFSMPYTQASLIDSALLASLIGTDSKEIKQGVRRMLGLIPMNAVQSFVFLAWLVLLDLKLFVLFLMVLLPAGLAIRILGRTLKKLAQQGIETQTELLGLFVERLTGWETIRIFRSLAFELQKFHLKNLELYKSLRRSARAASLGAPIVEWLGTAAGAFVVIIALRRLSIGELSDSVLTGFLVTIAMLSGTLQNLTKQLASIKKSRASMDRVSDFLAEAAKYSAQRPPDGPREQIAKEKIHEFECVNLSVRKSNSPEILIKSVSQKLMPGDFWAITGPSGSGKSTLLRCLLGLEAPHAGEVKINGKVGSELLWSKLSQDLAFIAQDPFIIKGTILENICFPHSAETSGAREMQGTPNQERALQCLRKAGLTKALDHSIAGLSGGEKQRVVLARAFYKDATLWILDEASSALDAQTEQSFLQILKENAKNHIVIFVTHRESVKAFANKHFQIESML